MTLANEPKLRQLLTVFLKENAKLNLSALRTEEDCWVGHILDSLSALELDVFKKASSPLQILDIGTGGGFPLLPLAISLPQHHWYGLDATAKKIEAIKRMAMELGIQNCHLITGRTEECAHESAHREQYDIVTARAVAPLNVLLEYCIGFVKLHGYIIAWKSMNIDQELQDSLSACSILSCHLIKTHVYTLPDTWGTRQLLVFQKIGETSKKYPRANGVPKKNPLI